MKWMACLAFALPLLSQTVSYTRDSTGITSISYNAREWVYYTGDNGQARFPMFVNGGSCTSSVGGGYSPTLSTQTTGTGYTEHVYNSGTDYQFTVRWTYATPDASTLTIAVLITNQAIEPMCGLDAHTPGISIPATVAADANFNWAFPVESSTILHPAIYQQFTGGSFATWISGAGGSDVRMTASGTTNFDWQARWGWTYGPTAQRTNLAVSGTKTFTQYYRFSTSQPGATTLAAEAYAAWQSANPRLSYSPDRRPWAQLIISDTTDTSSTNPRGYFNDNSLVASDSSAFLTAANTYATNAINVLNARVPRPQGVIIWDIEGQEFDHTLTYLCSPDKLPVIAPEMDAIADSFVGQFKTAGYEVGFCVRPTHFSTGTTVPGSCTYNSPWRSDVFIDTDASYPNRGYICGSGSTYVQEGAQKPGLQKDLFDYAAVVSGLSTKIGYAKTRWGAKAFYVDSTIWFDASVNIEWQAWRDVQALHPDVMIAPENHTDKTLAYTSQYQEYRNGVKTTSTYERGINPGAFSVLNVADIATTDSAVVAAVRQGDILLYNGWWPAPELPHTDAVYQAALIANTCIVVTNSANSRNRSFSANPGTAFKYPVKLRVYFDDDSDLSDATAYCAEDCTINLTGMTHYQLRLYDFEGTLVSAGTAAAI